MQQRAQLRLAPRLRLLEEQKREQEAHEDLANLVELGLACAVTAEDAAERAAQEGARPRREDALRIEPSGGEQEPEGRIGGKLAEKEERRLDHAVRVRIEGLEVREEPLREEGRRAVLREREDLIPVLEVRVDGRPRDPRLRGDVADARLLPSEPADAADRGVHQPVPRLALPCGAAPGPGGASHDSLFTQIDIPVKSASMRRLVAGLVLVAAAASGCLWRLFPEPYAVNTPVLHYLLGTSAGAPDAEALQHRIRVPEGFAVAVYADGLARPRFLRFTPAGDLLVSQPNDGRILLLARDADDDGRADGERVLLDGLAWPHGFDLHDGWLYVAQSESLVRIRFDAERGAVKGALETVAPLPEGVGHWYRNVRIGPDGAAYVTVGSSCNVCEEEDPRHATMLRFALDGSGQEVVARGLRNAEGFDWHPDSGEIYATEAGRDFLGDDFPPEELNRIVPGGFYGWPYANGANVPDPDYGEGKEELIATARPPAHEFPAHTTPLGITFLRDPRWPDDYRHAALVALHGSWNRNKKQGYEVVSLHWREDGSLEERPFLSGFLRGDDVIGRPVDVAEGPDGAAYVSDDHAGAIYRIHRGDGGAGTLEVAARAPSILAGSDPLAGVPDGERRSLGEQGAAIFVRYDCARCHDPERRVPGVVAMPLSNLASRWNVDGLAAFLARPRPPMPTFPLREEERRALAVFLLTE